MNIKEFLTYRDKCFLCGKNELTFHGSFGSAQEFKVKLSLEEQQLKISSQFENIFISVDMYLYLDL